MSIEVIQDKFIIVHAAGEIDLYNVEEFSKALDEAADKSPGGFIIDLSELMYIDTAGVQAIYNVHKKINPMDGCMGIVVGNATIRSVLEMIHLEMLQRMHVYNDLDTAIESFPTCKQGDK